MDNRLNCGFWILDSGPLKKTRHSDGSALDITLMHSAESGKLVEGVSNG